MSLSAEFRVFTVVKFLLCIRHFSCGDDTCHFAIGTERQEQISISHGTTESVIACRAVGQLGAYQKRHGLKACTIAQLIEYRRRSEKLVFREQTVKMPTDFGEYDCHLYRVTTDASHHLALTKGVIDPDQSTLVRVHSECLTGDVFQSQRCDCGGQLAAALEHISKEGGVLLYLRQEGRGIGLPAKMHAYKLQEEGMDTIEANEKLGYGSDLRDYGMGAQILYDLGVRKMRLLTNNPKKVIGLEGYGLEIVQQLPISLPSNPHNAKYLETKRTRMGHTL